MARTVKEYQLPIVQGADFDETLTWTIDGTPVNLTGYTAALRIGVRGTTRLELTSGAGLTLGGSAGTIRVQISDTQTDTLETSSYLAYELDVTSGGGITTRLIHGRVALAERVAS